MSDAPPHVTSIVRWTSVARPVPRESVRTSKARPGRGGACVYHRSVPCPRAPWLLRFLEVCTQSGAYQHRFSQDGLDGTYDLFGFP